MTPQTNQPPKLSNAANIARLVRRGLLPTKDLPSLKMAMINQQRKGDIAKLPKNQRDVLQRYNSALSGAAYGSQTSYQALMRNVREDFEITRDEYISEERQGDPPMMIVLKRRGVRIFPDGKRVALYVNEKLGLTFTIPYKSFGPEDVIGVSEETEQVIESFEQLQKYASQEEPKAKSRHFKFADGTKMPIAHGVAKAMHMVHGALNDQNKRKYEAMLNEPKGFKKAADFALSRVQFSINK
jgi:hypothetical protein